MRRAGGLSACEAPRAVVAWGKTKEGDSDMGKAILYLADGTEECEALLCADMLRRAGAEVILTAAGGRREIVSSHGVIIRADALAEEADIAGTDLLILPGGWPGTKHLEDCPAVREAVLTFAAAGKPIAAICAAPSILGHLGLLKGRRATAFPSFRKELARAILTEGDVVRDGPFLTAPGLGAAIPFALALVETLEGPAAARDTAERIGWRQN